MPSPPSAPVWLTSALRVAGCNLAESPIGIVDVGAAGAPPPNQACLASISTYLGFDPDLRSPKTGNAFGFLRHALINRAVTAHPRDTVTFHLTKYPECSSVLSPDPAQTSRYAIGDFFHVVGQAEVSAITLDAAIEQAGLSHVDWLKLDTQGTDYDLLTSLSPERFNRLLVVDVEPGVVPFYHDENTIAQIHGHMLQNGFWLADLSQQRFPRLSVDTIRKLGLGETDVALLDRNPFALELRYCRTLEHLEAQNLTTRDYLVLWLVAMANGHTSYAVEIAANAPCRGLDSDVGRSLLDITLDTCRAHAARRHRGTFAHLVELCFPPILPRAFRHLRQRGFFLRS